MTPVEWRIVLLKAAPHGKAWILDGFADALPDLCVNYAIDTPVRQQHFIAQCAHESDHWATTKEYASGAAYEGRKDLGNTSKGDGRKFRGRGLIQLTGRANYAAAARAMEAPFLDQPELVERFPFAADVSGWFWRTHGCNELADKDDVKLVTRRVNGGLNGLASRTAALESVRGLIA